MTRARTLASWALAITIPWCVVSAIVGTLVIQKSGFGDLTVSEAADLRSGRILAHSAIAAATTRLLEGGETPIHDGKVTFLNVDWPLSPDAAAFLKAIDAIQSGNQVVYEHYRNHLMLSGFAKTESNHIGTQAVQALAAHLSLDVARPDRAQLLDLLSVATVVVTRSDRAMQLEDQRHIRAESACWYAPLLPACVKAAYERNYVREPFQERALDAFIRSEPARHAPPPVEEIMIPQVAPELET